MNDQGDGATTQQGLRAFLSGSTWVACGAAAALVVACSGTDEWQTDQGNSPESKPESATSAADGATAPESNDAYADDPIWQAYQRARREFAGSYGEPLGQFAAKCDLATGIHVPDFKCSAGTEVPTTNYNGTSCDRPEQLHQKCDPGSRFQIVASNANAAAILHCRRGGNPTTGNNYHDIAIIQYNWVNGAVCYYQALGTMDGDFKAPVLGTSSSGEADFLNSSASPWVSSAHTHAIDCRQCHDNGAVIRSPYMSQMRTAPNALPGAGVRTFNGTNPVAYVGTDFQDWRLYSVTLQNNTCNGCHRMGYSNTPEVGKGTALDFGIRATNRDNIAKNPNSAASPIWMIPPQTDYDEANHVSAVALQACAQALKNGTAPPAGCSSTQFSKLYRGLDPAQLFVAL